MLSMKLNNGINSPKVSFLTATIGSFQRCDEYAVDTLSNAIKIGYRSSYNSSFYKNKSSSQAISKWNSLINRLATPKSKPYLTYKITS
ncbi:hypothetical protein [Marinomonas balearica]|uniref:Uncharacterized protein n=1 Tax=Marinomonas balearica TaxID=491947 RepID=A0A4R6M295_9GAMM|nr:hypothetical protein [Marinomonas balearica]TDO95371.1 hypothetical protein DFP79_3613 [Marinomonas balearica]